MFASKKGMTSTQAVVIAIVILVVGVGGTAAFFLSQGPVTQVQTRTQIQTQTVTAQPPIPPVVFKNHTLIGIQTVNIDADPNISKDNIVQMQAYEQLTRLKYDGSVVPELALSWTPNADLTEWTFKLRQGVKLHDGTTFDASAVKFTIERSQKEPLQNAFVFQQPFAKPCCEIIDAYTIKLKAVRPIDLPGHVSTPWSAYITGPSCVSFAKAENDTKALKAWFEKGNSCGTGPYVLKKIDPLNEAVLERFEGYWRGWKPDQVKSIIIKVILENPVLIAQSLAIGQADFSASGIGLPQLPVVTGSDKVDIQKQTPWLAVNYIMFNVKKAPLDNSKVRQALLYAIPYDQIIKTVLSGFGQRVPGYIGTPSLIAGYNKSITSYNFDMERARKLLTEAGFPNGLGGVKLVITYPTSTPEWKDAFELTRPNWAQLGVDMDVRGMIFPALIGMAKSPNPMDVFLTVWTPVPPTPFTPMNDFWGTGSFWNFGQYSNPALDQLLKRALETEARSKKEALPLYSQAQEILIKDAPGYGAFARDLIFPMSKRFTGHSVTDNFHWSVIAYNLRGVN